MTHLFVLLVVHRSKKVASRSFYNGEWGTVCDPWLDCFGQTFRHSCHSIGLGNAEGNLGGGRYEQNAYNFDCQGFQPSILRCGRIGVNNCQYRRNAGVRCYEGILAPVRLAGGPSLQEGRVEILYNGEWGTVCDRGWTVFDKPSDIVCYSIGLGNAEATYGGGRYEQGTGPMVLDDVFCPIPTVTSIIQCRSEGFGVGYCNPSAEAGVRCGRSPQGKNPNQLSL
eukprot:XP_011662888.1 PREDICTED: neurotrypsin-like [Strongylocentrotus purpuratus]